MGPKKGPQRLQVKGRQQPRKRSSSTAGHNSFDQAASGEDPQWSRDIAILRRAAEQRAHGQALKLPAPSLNSGDTVNPFAGGFEYLSVGERSAIVRRFYDRNPDQAASLVNVALRESSPEQRCRIGAALVGSGLVSEAIASLTGENNRDTYGAFSLLFLAAKAGEIDPIVRVIETHGSVELRLKLIGLLVSSGEREILEAFRRLAVNQSLTVELHSTIVQAINQLNGHGFA